MKSRLIVLLFFCASFTLAQSTKAVVPAKGETETKQPVVAKAETIPPMKRPIPLAKTMAIGRQFAKELMTGDPKKLWVAMDAKMHELFKDISALDTMKEQLQRQLGTEQTTLNEVVMPVMPSYSVYLRRMMMTNYSGKLVLSMTFDSDGIIAGFFITPEKNPAESANLSYITKTNLQLPIQGEWFVYQGGRSTFENYHAEYAIQRFAYDLTLVKDDSLWRDDPSKLESFYSFGQTVLAPGDGKVVLADDKYDDNPVMKPSATNPKQGNSIVIDHGNGEFSMLAHLKRGSLKVNVGDTVKAGQQIAQCGNSGNSPFPHLHYHLQTTASWSMGEGLPTLFKGIVVNGKAVETGEPSKGQVISNK
jgi:hypothetical protein